MGEVYFDLIVDCIKEINIVSEADLTQSNLIYTYITQESDLCDNYILLYSENILKISWKSSVVESVSLYNIS